MSLPSAAILDLQRACKTELRRLDTSQDNCPVKTLQTLLQEYRPQLATAQRGTYGQKVQLQSLLWSRAHRSVTLRLCMAELSDSFTHSRTILSGNRAPFGTKA